MRRDQIGAIFVVGVIVVGGGLAFTSGPATEPPWSVGRDGPAHPLDGPGPTSTTPTRWVETTETTEPCGATYERFLRIKPGNSLKYVTRIMGCEGELVSSTRVGSDTYRTLQWTGPKPYTNATIMFHGSTVSSVAQFGLR